jgi:hypothetical protein
MQSHRAALAAFALFFTFLPAQSGAQQIPTTPTPTPAPPAPYVSIEEEVSPNYDDENGSSSLVNLRGQFPYLAGTQYVFRLRLPIVTSAPASALTGAGDLALFDLAVTDVAQGRWLEGVTIRVPSAQNDSLGSGKYSVGPAFGYETQQGPWTLGFFQQNFFSVVGPTSRSPVGQSKIEPSVALALARGWSIGLSSMTITYDWVRNEWTEVPVGMRVAKRFSRGLSPLEASVEMEQNLADARGAPGWTIRTMLKWTLPR